LASGNISRKTNSFVYPSAISKDYQEDSNSESISLFGISSDRFSKEYFSKECLSWPSDGLASPSDDLIG